MAIVLSVPGGPVVNRSNLFGKPSLRSFIPLQKRERTRWGPIPKRRRWGQPDDQKSLSEDVKHLAEVAGTMSEKESQSYFLKLKLAQNAKKLHNIQAALEANPNELSPSPPPQYDSAGKRLNTKEIRLKLKLETERNDLFTKIMALDKNFKIPEGWRKPIYRKKIVLPYLKHPEINFFGVIVGPRGITQKRLSKETGCNIFIRGRGSFDSGKHGRVPQEDDNDPMYVAISGPSQAQVDKAFKMCSDLIAESTSGDSKKNKQLAELRNVLGWGGNEAKRCRICGGVGHPIWKCPDRPGADWTPAEVQCSLCGEVSHITTDCKLYNKDAPEVKEKALTLNQEYSKFLDDLAGDGNMKTKAVGAIVGSRATSAELYKLKSMGTQKKAQFHRGPKRGRGNYSVSKSLFSSRGPEVNNLSPPMLAGGLPLQTFNPTAMHQPYMIPAGYPALTPGYPSPTFNPVNLPTSNPQLIQMPSQGTFVQQYQSYPPPQYYPYVQS